MQYTILLDQVRCVQWGLSLPEGVVLEVIARAAGWADPIQDERGTFYRITHGKFRQELPLILKSEQTGRRILEGLAEKEIIEKALFGNNAAYRLTEKGRQWNSDHPTKMEGLPYQNGRVDPTKMEGPSIRVPLSDNQISNTESLSVIPAEAEKKEYGVPEINELLHIIKEHHGSVDGTVDESRRYSSLLLKKLEKAGAEKSKIPKMVGAVIEKVIESGHSFTIGLTTSPKSLYFNWAKIGVNVKTAKAPEETKNFGF